MAKKITPKKTPSGIILPEGGGKPRSKTVAMTPKEAIEKIDSTPAPIGVPAWKEPGKVPFTPYKGMIVIKVPGECYPTGGIHVGKPAAFEEMVLGKLKDKIGGKLEVAAVASDVQFCKKGDEIVLQGNSVPQRLMTDRENSEYGYLWLIVREFDLLANFGPKVSKK